MPSISTQMICSQSSGSQCSRNSFIKSSNVSFARHSCSIEVQSAIRLFSKHPRIFVIHFICDSILCVYEIGCAMCFEVTNNFGRDVTVGHYCNGHYNRTPDLGKCGMWWNVWDLARYSILDAKVLDRNVTWLTKHKDTS